MVGAQCGEGIDFDLGFLFSLLQMDSLHFFVILFLLGDLVLDDH